jgi:hypothetical protein
MILPSPVIWVAAAEQLPSEQDLSEAARVAVSGRVTAPAIGVFPGGLATTDPQVMGLVGVPAWFWVKNAGWGIGRSETVWDSVTTPSGTYSLAATVSFAKTVYDTGDGVLTCRNLGDDPNGRVHDPQEPPRGCFHTYLDRGLFHVVATTHLTIDWVGAGKQGQIRDLTVVQERDYRVGEIQVVAVHRP